MYVGKTIDPDSAYYSLVNWSGSDDSVFTVDSNGQITGVAKGNATLTAQINNASADATVSVYELSSNVSGSDDQTTVTDAAADTVEQITKGEDTPKAEIDNADQAKKELEEAAKRGDEFSGDMSKDDKSKEDLGADWDKAQSAAGGKEFGGAYDVTLDFKHKDQSGADHHIGNITELDKDITFELEMPKGLPEVEAGHVREYSVVRIHDGEAESIPFETTEDGNFRVTSSKFSDYVIAYSDTATSTEDTSDYIVGWTTSGTCEWSIDADGNLVVRPANGAASGELASARPWSEQGKSIKSVTFKSGVSSTSALNMFSGCAALESVDLSGFDSSKTTDMNGMFYNCKALTTVDLCALDTSNVTDMGYMFSGCSSLASLDLGEKFSTSNVTAMGSMFSGCSSLASLDLSSFNTSNVADMGSMFNGCSSLNVVTLGEKFNRSVVFPAPSGDDYVGTWLSSADGIAYDSGNIPSNVAATYVAARGVDRPSVNGNLVYNGFEQVGVTAGEGYTVTGGSETAPGNYTAIVSLNDKSSFVWRNTGQAADQSLDWSIADPTVRVPVAKSLSYNGGVQKGVAAGDGYTLTGDVSATEVGDCFVVAKLTDPANYAWDDGTTADKCVHWSIDYAMPTYEVPTGLTASCGQTLADVALPYGFSWQDDLSTSVGEPGEHTFLATYTPADTANYTVVCDIPVTVTVSQPVYRMYNSITSEHLFTTDFDEYSSLTAHDWRQEGVSWCSPAAGKGVYRVYNPGLGAMAKMSHHYTSDYAEAADLVANHGWRWDNGGQPIFYSAEDDSGNALAGASKVYRLYNGGLSAHHFTLDASEANSLMSNHGWNGEDVGFYAFPAVN